MFWKKKPKEADKDKAPADDAAAAPPGKLSREQVIAKAKATAAAAREEIGNETLEAIREAITRRQNSPAEKAKQIIKAMDDSKVKDHLSQLLKDEKNKTRH